MKAPSLRVESPRQSYPSLFGRYTAVFSGHEKLQETMSKVREMGQIVARCDKFPAELRPSTLLQVLLEELQEHFEFEESEQYFGTLEMSAPELKDAVLKLRTEHAAILHAVHNLLDLSTHESRERGLASAAEGVLAWLERHEAEETAVMREFLSRETQGSTDARETQGQDGRQDRAEG